MLSTLHPCRGHPKRQKWIDQPRTKHLRRTLPTEHSLPQSLAHGPNARFIFPRLFNQSHQVPSARSPLRNPPLWEPPPIPPLNPPTPSSSSSCLLPLHPGHGQIKIDVKRRMKMEMEMEIQIKIKTKRYRNNYIRMQKTSRESDKTQDRTEDGVCLESVSCCSSSCSCSCCCSCAPLPG